MQEFGGFEIEFIGNINMKYEKKSIKESVFGITESWGNVEISDNASKVYVTEDNYIDFNKFDGLFEKICKQLAICLSEVSFNGIAHYSNFSTNYDVYNIITYRYRKKELIIKNIFGECLDGYCTKCGKRLFTPSKGIVSDVYYCNNCKENINFNINFNEYVLDLKSDNSSSKR